MHDLFKISLAKRDSLLSPETNAIRLIDGSGDGFPGVILETFADRWLLSTSTDRIPETLRDRLLKSRKPVYWKRLDQHQKESPSHLGGPEVTEPFLMRENGMNLEISFQSGYSQGIFLDQRDNRSQVRAAVQTGSRVLNTFAYTGAFSIAAALGGAETTTLDLSQPYLNWSKRNFSHNDLDPGAHHFCKGDTFHWLKRFAKQGRQFDGIILDPPTFSRDEKGRVFRVEENYGELAALAINVLAPDGWLLCSTNCKTLPPGAFERQLLSASPRRFKATHNAMPADFTGDPYLKSVWLR